MLKKVFTAEEIDELEKTGVIDDPEDSSACYVTGAYLTKQQASWADEDPYKNEQFGDTNVFWWGDDIQYIDSLESLKKLLLTEQEQMDAYAALRELISFGWTLDTFDTLFVMYDNPDWDKSKRDAYWEIFKKAWEDAQEEMKEAKEKQEKVVIYSVLKTWGSEGHECCDQLFESTDREAAIAEFNRVKGEEAGAEYIMWAEIDGIGHKYSPEYNMIDTMFYTCDRETWTLIDEFETKEEAMAAVRDYESEDGEANGFYDVITLNAEGERVSVN